MSAVPTPVPLADGLTGHALVALPERRPARTVVLRTMYDATRHAAEATAWASRGYAFVVADVRGRYRSAGRFVPYRHERADGGALLDWISAQPWSDGRVVAYGASYAAHAAWAAAVDRPGAVDAVVSLCPSLSLGRTKRDRSGVLRLAEHAGWWAEHGDTDRSRPSPSLATGRRALDALPVTGVPHRLGLDLPGFASVLADPDGHGVPGDDELAMLDVPALHVAGWYDVARDQATELYSLVGRDHGHTAGRRLVLGPWGHDLGLAGSTRVGDVEHGTEARRALGSLVVDWLADPTSGVDAFVIGDGWHRWDTWPPAARTRTLALPHDARFEHDPLDPYPSRPPGRDRGDLRGRRDAARLRFVVDRAMTVVGRPTATLRVTADGPADWVVRLLAGGDGTREVSVGTACTPVAGCHDVQVVLDETATTLAAGDTVVVELAGADHPRLARNLGTGARTTGTRTAVVRQRVLAHGSRVHLPELAA